MPSTVADAGWLPALPAAPSCGSTYGLAALVRELEDQRAPIGALLERIGTEGAWPGQPDLTLRHDARLAFLRQARALATRPDTALRAGQRQRIADFGVFGFAMATSVRLGQALDVAREHLDLTGSVLRITFAREGEFGVFRSQAPQALGDMLPFVAEFWRSSMTTLLGEVLGARFPSRSMSFPYPAPPHAAAYREVFGCPVQFANPVMEWRFDAAALDWPCANANALTSQICRSWCERVAAMGQGQTPLQRAVRRACLGHPRLAPTAAAVAASLGLSVRTLFRRLREEGTSLGQLLDETRRSIAIDYLSNTQLAVDEIGARVGFADDANFRKAFRRWTGLTPAEYRASGGRVLSR